MKYILFIIFIFTVFGLSAQKERKHIRKGNESFEKEEFGNSEVAYQKALSVKPESFEAAFNLGDALYKQGKYEEAAKQFQSLASPDLDKKDLSKIYHNLGNTYLSENKLKKSIEAYKNALRNNPDDDDTRYNLAYAQKLLEQQQNQQNKNQQGQNQQDQNQDQQQKQQDQQNQDQQSQNQQSQDQQGQSQKNQPENYDDADGDGIPDEVEKGNQPQNPRDTDNDKKPDFQDYDSDNDGLTDAEEAGPNPREPQDTDKDGLPDYRDTDSDNDGKPDSEDAKKQPRRQYRISPEDAMRLLEALENDEKRVQEKVKEEMAKSKKTPVEKDW